MQIAGGTSIKKLQALLGHKSAMETWDTYAPSWVMWTIARGR